MLARLLGLLQIVVGVCLWLGIATGLVKLHTGLGSLLVLVAWVVAGIALFALPQRRIPLITLLMGGVVLWFGMAQTTLLPGTMHWAVRVVHLLLGLALLGLIETLRKAVSQHLATRGE